MEIFIIEHVNLLIHIMFLMILRKNILFKSVKADIMFLKTATGESRIIMWGYVMSNGYTVWRLWLRGRAVVLQPEGRQFDPQSSPCACRRARCWTLNCPSCELQMWKDSLTMLQRYNLHKAKNVLCKVTLTSSFLSPSEHLYKVDEIPWDINSLRYCVRTYGRKEGE